MRTLLILALCPLAWGDFIDSTVPTNVVLTQQLSGDITQIYNWNQTSPSMYGFVTQTLSESTAVTGPGHMGMWGMDEGACGLITSKNDIVCVSGDVESAYWATSPQNGWQMFSRNNTGCTTLGAITGGSTSCLALKDVWVIPNSGGSIFDGSGCTAINAVAASISTPHNNTNTPTVSYTGCNPVVIVSNTSHTSSQPGFAAVTVTHSSGGGTQNDQAGNALTIVAGHEFQSCIDATVSGTDTFLCNVNESRIADATGSPLYLGATVLQSAAVSTLYSGGSFQTTRSSEVAFTATYTNSGYGVIGQAPPITNITGVTVALASSTSTSFTYTLTTSGTSFTSGMVGSLIEATTNGSNFVQAIISAFNSGTSVTVFQTGGTVAPTEWTIGSGQTVTLQPAPYDMLTPNPATGQNIGKFLICYLGYVSHSALATWPWTSKLPPALQSATDGVILVWGSWAQYGRSNLYFGVVDPDTLATSAFDYTATGVTGTTPNGTGATGGLHTMYYVTALDSTGSIPTWTQGREDMAIPLITGWSHTQGKTSFTQECINEHSVEFSAGVHRWLLTYGFAQCGGFMMRTGLSPWGPWSQETNVFTNNINASLNAGSNPGGGNYWANNWYTLTTYNNSGNQPGFTNLNTTLPANAPITCASCQGGAATPQLYQGTGGSAGTTLCNNTSGLCNSGPWTNLGAGYGFRLYPGQEKINANGSVTRGMIVSVLSPYTPFEGLVTINISVPGSGSGSGVAVVH
jgi:hypothetical protein